MTDLEREHGDLVWHVNVVPDTQTVPVLGHNHITLRHPLHIRAVVQKRCPTLTLQIKNIQLEWKEYIKMSCAINYNPSRR